MMTTILAQADTPGIQDTTGQVDVDMDSIWERIDNMVDGFLRLLPNLAIGLVVLAVFIFAGKLLKRGIRKSAEKAGRTNLGIVGGRLASWLAMLGGLLVATSIVAPSISPGDLLATLGIGGVAIGFAFKDILQNFLAGILILLRQPFEIGDQIEVDGFEGTVKDIETRATLLKTYDGKRIVIPNGQIFTNAVVVKTAHDARRSQYDIGIGYGDDIDEACDLIMETLQNTDGVLSDPAPQVLVMDLAGSSVNLRARWWTDPQKADVMRTKDAVIRGVKSALDKAAIDMPYPTQVVLFHDQTEESDGDRTKQREGWPAGEQPPKPARISKALEKSSRNGKGSPDQDGSPQRDNHRAGVA
ncbi:MAG: mechanosensitive ion channel family protein [Akkermansiaceae bacterium]|nr:mechanosensitive ion channel family protein [Akkermansiaceae bacterium]NNM28580.1 mechanosensitive ion channel family protein [Akkermansiaceae bacterium]